VPKKSGDMRSICWDSQQAHFEFKFRGRQSVHLLEFAVKSKGRGTPEEGGFPAFLCLYRGYEEMLGRRLDFIANSAPSNLEF
jgi:hypothetical protein